MKEIIRKLLESNGWMLRKIYDLDMGSEFVGIQERVEPYTMTSLARQYALYEAVEYLEKFNIEGEIVECGVWKGGSAMIAALTLLARGSTERELWLYDTFAGMPKPSERDVNINGLQASERWESLKDMGGWDVASREDVEENMRITGYPQNRIRIIEGMVEDTLKIYHPERIALLRLDTDWYESTKSEFEHLFPRLVSGGVLILDDYGHWGGARKAADEYFEKCGIRPYLHRIDYTGRIMVKT